MNVTHLLGLVPEFPDDQQEAVQQLADRYPGIMYFPSDDSYRYRGVEFDYFKSGVSIGLDGPNNYTLVSKTDRKNWLFNYGDKESRWKEFLARHNKRDVAVTVL